MAVAIAADAKANRERVVPVTNGAREMAVAPSGKEVAFIARGDVFVTSVEGGVTKRITTTPEEERGVGFSPDGKALVYASERGGRWADLRGPQDARRGAVLLRVHRPEGDARSSRTRSRTTSRSIRRTARSSPTSRTATR